MINVRAEPAPTAQLRPTTWPMGTPQWAALLASYLGLVAIWTGLGLALTGPLENTAVVRFDERVAVWFAKHRTPTLDTYTLWGSELSGTLIKIIATALLALVLFLIWRSWIEPLLLALSLILEAATFITVTWLVGRPRPDVPRLEGSPVDSSFPSGHAAAAAAYGALVVIVFRRTDRRSVRSLAVVLCIAIPAVVGLSRMYRGMHYLSDVLAGVLLGVASVILTAVILSPEVRRSE